MGQFNEPVHSLKGYNNNKLNKRKKKTNRIDVPSHFVPNRRELLLQVKLILLAWFSSLCKFYDFFISLFLECMINQTSAAQKQIPLL